MFLRTGQVDFLGHVVDCRGVRVDGEKLRSIKKVPRPRSATELGSILGLYGYHRRFNRGLALQRNIGLFTRARLGRRSSCGGKRWRSLS